jgi:hypothetical protein
LLAELPLPLAMMVALSPFAVDEALTRMHEGDPLAVLDCEAITTPS